MSPPTPPKPLSSSSTLTNHQKTPKTTSPPPRAGKPSFFGFKSPPKKSPTKMNATPPLPAYSPLDPPVLIRPDDFHFSPPTPPTPPPTQPSTTGRNGALAYNFILQHYARQLEVYHLSLSVWGINEKLQDMALDVVEEDMTKRSKGPKSKAPKGEEAARLRAKKKAETRRKMEEWYRLEGMVDEYEGVAERQDESERRNVRDWGEMERERFGELEKEERGKGKGKGKWEMEVVIERMD